MCFTTPVFRYFAPRVCALSPVAQEDSSLNKAGYNLAWSKSHNSFGGIFDTVH